MSYNTMTKKTTAEVWIEAVNAKLPVPIVAGSREDEIAFDCYVAGKTSTGAADAVTKFRHLTYTTEAKPEGKK